MTDLSNIFIGDQVVTQAYYRDAVLYKSKGWQTLPSTLQEQWHKEYSPNMNLLFAHMCKDDSIYVLVEDDTTAKITLQAIDTNGNLIMKQDLTKFFAQTLHTDSGHKVSGYIYERSDKLLGIEINYPYLLSSPNTRLLSIEYDYTINIVTFYIDKDMSNDYLLGDICIESYVYDYPYLYAIGYYCENSTRYWLFKIDTSNYYSLVKDVELSSAENRFNLYYYSNTLIVSSYLASILVKYNPTDLTKLGTMTIGGATSDESDSSVYGFAQDSLGYGYLSNYYALTKIDSSFNKVNSYSTVGLGTGIIHVDKQDNIIQIQKSSSEFYSHIVKYSSDLTKIYDYNLGTYNLGSMNGYIFSDSNNNTYLVYYQNSLQFSIIKWLNIYK